MLKILLLTQWFDPEPSFKGLIFAKELVKQGFKVEVLTGFPNYPGGNLYPGYKIKIVDKEVHDNIEVTRVPLYPSHNKSAFLRILNYLSFCISSIIYGIFTKKRVDIIYAYHPPLTVGIAAVILKYIWKIPVVYDVQDMWPDTLKATGMIKNKSLLSVVGLICKWIYNSVDNIVVLSPGFKKLLVERHVPENKIDVIYNWCAENELNFSYNDKKISLTKKGTFHILFAGNMGKAQSLNSVLDAAEKLLQTAPGLFFVFLGSGVEVDLLKKNVFERSLKNVVFFPSVPMNEVGRFLYSADALLVHLKKDPLFRITIPSKIQAYMAVGKPILMALDGDAADLVRHSNSGILAESDDPESIAEAAKTLLNFRKEELSQMANNGKKYYQENLSLQSGVKKFCEVFYKAMKKSDSIKRV